MPSWKPRVEVDTARQQRQLDQLGVARPGPTSYGPLDGHIRLHDGSNDTGYLNFNGFQVRFRGALAGLTPHLEANATKNEQQDGRLDGHDSTLSSHDTRITNEVADRKSADLALHGRVSQETEQRKSADSSLSSRISTARSRADSAYTLAENASSAASTAQSRADSAWTRAGNAQSTADSASSAASTAAARAAKIINCINGIVPAGASLSGGEFSTMATANEWQQLKNCINS